jgi:hypothetical protein
MGAITVQTEVTSLEQSKSQAITGVIYFDFVNHQFPEKGWNDFIVVVLCWWLSALKSIAFEDSDSEELLFMDGPLYINVKKLNNGLYCVECFDRGVNRDVKFSAEYQLADILDSVLCAAKSIYSVCSQKGWKNDDLIELKKLIKEFS